MVWLRYEYFGHITYDSELSYEEVMVREERLTTFMQQTLTEFNALHLDFTSTGEGLQVQCAFTEILEITYMELCNAIACCMINGVSGTFLLICRNLKKLKTCVIAEGIVHQKEIVIQSPQVYDIPSVDKEPYYSV